MPLKEQKRDTIEDKAGLLAQQKKENDKPDTGISTLKLKYSRSKKNTSKREEVKGQLNSMKLFAV